MDAPLILTTRIDPSEIDKEAHNVDINWQYPVEFYELTQSIPDAKDAITKGGIVTVAQVLGTPAEYTGFGYTHLTDDANEGGQRIILTIRLIVCVKRRKHNSPWETYL